MGGSGERFGSSLPKQFHRLAGKKIYQYTLEAFIASNLFEQIILVCPKPWIDSVRQDLTAYPNTPIILTLGGDSRQESSFLGLLACGNATQIVVIHDAVRPFVSQKILQDNVSFAREHDAVNTCIPSADTLVYAPSKEKVTDIPLRAHYLRGQTPQSFAYPLILEAHQYARTLGITESSDDCSLVLNLKKTPISIVEGSEENIKITSELDLFLAEQLLRLKKIPSSSLSSKNSLQGKRIAITGGMGGIGSVLCKMLEEEGALPVIISRSAPLYTSDLTSYDNVRAVFDQILREVGPLDALINSIGLLKNRPLRDLVSSEIDELIATNLTAVIYSCKCAHLKNGAHIINIASSSYVRGRKEISIYASAKAALVNFSQGLAEERSDLRVNVLIPQRTNTSMRKALFPEENPETLLSPNEVAREMIQLLKTNFITGSLVEVRKK